MSLDPRIKIKYGQLCQELGHLQCNLEQLQKRIADIKSEIHGLNLAAPFLKIIPEPKQEPKSGE